MSYLSYENIMYTARVLHNYAFEYEMQSVLSNVATNFY